MSAEARLVRSNRKVFESEWRYGQEVAKDFGGMVIAASIDIADDIFVSIVRRHWPKSLGFMKFWQKTSQESKDDILLL